MRKTLIAIIILICYCSVTMAQPRAIGGRLGFGFGASYQHDFGEKNMLQVDLDAIAYNRFGHTWGIQAVATYNWIFPFKSWSGPGSWNWYAGIGGGIGMLSEGELEVNFGVAGMIGIEYNFKFPLQLSLDLRPVIGPCFLIEDRSVFISGVGIFLNSVTIGIRYKF